MCLTYQNPTQRAQNADPIACAMKLPFSVPRRSIERLVAMASDEDWHIRVVPAGHPATPQDTLQALAADESFHVRSWVVRNLSTGTEILAFMTMDVDAGISAYAKLMLNSVPGPNG